MFHSRFRALAGMAAVCLALALAAPAGAQPLRLVAFGDSLTAGYGVASADSFPAVLQAILRARGHDVEVINAGVSGDTTEDGLARFDWSVPADVDAAIVEFGGNDALRALPPHLAKANLAAIVRRFQERGVPVLLAGMRAPPNLGGMFGVQFNAMYRELAEETGVVLYPFFLEGVAGRPDLLQDDGIHPNAAGVRVIVDRILPSVEQLLSAAGARAAAGQ